MILLAIYPKINKNINLTNPNKINKNKINNPIKTLKELL
jgi:hypothetical protein